MAQVVVRVELHRAATEQQYEKLHSQMATAGFSRSIRGSDGATYQLPTAMYSSDRYATAEDARDAAYQAASGITQSYAVIATCGPSAWRGLS